MFKIFYWFISFFWKIFIVLKFWVFISKFEDILSMVWDMFLNIFYSIGYNELIVVGVFIIN